MIIETHGIPRDDNHSALVSETEAFYGMIRKFRNFYNACSDEYYIVLSLDKSLMKQYIELRGRDPSLKIAHEIWHVSDRARGAEKDRYLKKRIERLKRMAELERTAGTSNPITAIRRSET